MIGHLKLKVLPVEGGDTAGNRKNLEETFYSVDHNSLVIVPHLWCYPHAAMKLLPSIFALSLLFGKVGLVRAQAIETPGIERSTVSFNEIGAMLAKGCDGQAVEMYSNWTRSCAAWMPDGGFLQIEDNE